MGTAYREAIGTLSPHDTDAGGGRGFHTVVGFDDSPASHHALALGIGWSRRVGTQLDVVHVREVSGWTAYGEAAALYSPTVVATSASSHDVVRVAVARELDGRVADWTFSSVPGDVVDVLERHARELRADAILVGTPRSRIFGTGGRRIRRLATRTSCALIVVP